MVDTKGSFFFFFLTEGNALGVIETDSLCKANVMEEIFENAGVL